LPTPDASPDARVAEEEVQHLLKQRLADFRTTLTGKDIEIFDERLVAENPLTLQELGDRFGISRERVRQIEVRAFEKLQKAIKTAAMDRRLPAP